MAKRKAHADETPAAEDQAPTRVIGGMVKGLWSGVPIWTCPRCRDTTFNEGEAEVHSCKLPKMADQDDE